jgi:antitoxin component of MazEF toxin-antitoxin module
MGDSGVVRTATKGKGGSLLIVIPSQLAELYGIKGGDKLEWSQGGPGELRLRKASTE